MAVGSTQPLTPGTFLGGKGRPARKADNRTAIYGPGIDSASNRNEYQESSWGYRTASCKADNRTAIYELIGKCGSLDVSQPYVSSRSVTGIAFTFCIMIKPLT
jgi:hypothetical protein